MPFSIGATWPSLKQKTTIYAEDMNSKFEWLEGHRYPHSSGVLINSIFDIGGPGKSWNTGYFSNVLIMDGHTFTSSNIGGELDAWCQLQSVTETSYNITTYGNFFGGGGTHAYYYFDFTNAFTSNGSYAIGANSENRVILLTVTSSQLKLKMYRYSDDYPLVGNLLGIMCKE